MDKVAFLEELCIMVNAGEIRLVEGKEDATRLLQDIKRIVIESLCGEIVDDITDPAMGYYAPEFSSWKEFLIYCNGNGDYETILRSDFNNQDLEELWQNSHIAEEMSEEQIRQEMIRQIGQLKMISVMGRTAAANQDKVQRIKRGIKARITGLYNLLYE